MSKVIGSQSISNSSINNNNDPICENNSNVPIYKSNFQPQPFKRNENFNKNSNENFKEVNFSFPDSFSFDDNFSCNSSSSVVVDPISKNNNNNIPIDPNSGTDDIVRIFSSNLDNNSNYDCATIADRGTPVNIMNLDTAKKLNLLIRPSKSFTIVFLLRV